MAGDFKVKLSNFRAFSDTNLINIKPLTILVGENSTGKTSFLAALRYFFDLAQRPKSGYFNIPPFDLGSYDDIVHHSSLNSTNLRFSLAIEKEIDIATGGTMVLDPKAKPDVRKCSLTVYFGSKYGDVSLSSFVFQFSDTRVEYLSNAKPAIRILYKDREILIKENRERFIFSENTEMMSDDLKTISYRIFDYYFSSAHSKGGSKSSDPQLVLQAAQAFDAFISSSYALHSSPPVRSVPRRVYTSSDEGGYSDQSHAPHELRASCI